MISLQIPSTVLVPETIMSLEKIKECVNHIEEMLEIRVSQDNMEEMSVQIEEITAWYATSANMLASALFYKDVAYRLEYNKAFEKIGESDIPKEMKAFTSPSVLNKYIDSRNATFNYLAKKCERLNSGLTHRYEALRSLISKEKELFKMTQFAPKQN